MLCYICNCFAPPCVFPEALGHIFLEWPRRSKISLVYWIYRMAKNQSSALQCSLLKELWRFLPFVIGAVKKSLHKKVSAQFAAQVFFSPEERSWEVWIWKRLILLPLVYEMIHIVFLNIVFHQRIYGLWIDHIWDMRLLHKGNIESRALFCVAKRTKSVDVFYPQQRVWFFHSIFVHWKCTVYSPRAVSAG